MPCTAAVNSVCVWLALKADRYVAGVRAHCASSHPAGAMRTTVYVQKAYISF